MVVKEICKPGLAIAEVALTMSCTYILKTVGEKP